MSAVDRVALVVCTCVVPRVASGKATDWCCGARRAATGVDSHGTMINIKRAKEAKAKAEAEAKAGGAANGAGGSAGAGSGKTEEGAAPAPAGVGVAKKKTIWGVGRGRGRGKRKPGGKNQTMADLRLVTGEYWAVAGAQPESGVRDGCVV